MEDKNQSSRRKFIQQTALVGEGLMLADRLVLWDFYPDKYKQKLMLN